MLRLDLAHIRCIVFDFGMTLSSDRYFKIAPPGIPEWGSVIQQHIFDQRHIVNAWMAGELTLVDIAQIVARQMDVPIPVIIETMERGCSAMTFNAAVWEFATAQRAAGRKTALVTANMDVFTKIVVPAHGLDQIFDVILNSADHHELRKELLWDRAFALLGDGIDYGNSLLIEDSEKELTLFRSRGGLAVQYQNDERFREWLTA